MNIIDDTLFLFAIATTSIKVGSEVWRIPISACCRMMGVQSRARVIFRNHQNIGLGYLLLWRLSSVPRVSVLLKPTISETGVKLRLRKKKAGKIGTHFSSVPQT